MRVLCISDYFLPGYKGGGPIRTLENMRLGLSDRASISIFTRDHDLGSERYDGIQTNSWQESPGGAVFYADSQNFGVRGLARILRDKEFDLIYLNSFFSLHGSILPRLALPLLAPGKPILLAPRGEFSCGALSVKKRKKRLFLSLARALRSYRNVFWHASTKLEASDILKQFPGAADRIYVAPDPVVAPPMGNRRESSRITSNKLRLVFISRISPMKNLDGLLRILEKVDAPVDLDIYGPIEDKDYWGICQDRIAELPSNISVDLRGELMPYEVSGVFAEYDLFALPTLGENFGHVIFEALLAGTPVLISDRTPWKSDGRGAVRVVPLEDKMTWSSTIQSLAQSSIDKKLSLRKAAREYIDRYVEDQNGLRETYEMFRAIV